LVGPGPFPPPLFVALVFVLLCAAALLALLAICIALFTLIKYIYHNSILLVSPLAKSPSYAKSESGTNLVF
jgi:hypothetical protein